MHMIILANLVGLVVTSVELKFPIAKPNCSDRCGSVRIPFPFGTSKGCYLADEFFVNCTRSSSSSPIALLGHSEIEITNISVHGELTVLQSIAYRCPRRSNCTCVDVGSMPDPSSSPEMPEKTTGLISTIRTTRSNDFLDGSTTECTCIDKEGQSWINLESFTVSNTANKFTVVGNYIKLPRSHFFVLQVKMTWILMR